MEINKKISSLILAAQIASDAGKGIKSLLIKDNIKLGKDAQYNGYDSKDKLIAAAVGLIRTNRSDWRYYAERAKDQKGNISNVFYFTYNSKDGKYYQISFHCFSGGDLKEMSLKESGTPLHWDKKNSRKAAYKAYKALGGKAYWDGFTGHSGKEWRKFKGESEYSYSQSFDLDWELY